MREHFKVDTGEVGYTFPHDVFGTYPVNTTDAVVNDIAEADEEGDFLIDQEREALANVDEVNNLYKKYIYSRQCVKCLAYLIHLHYVKYVNYVNYVNFICF